MAFWIPSGVRCDALTRNVVAWVTLGFAYGGVAPLIWGAVVVALGAQIVGLRYLVGLQWRSGVALVFGARRRSRAPWGVVSLGVAIQLVLGVWYFMSLGG